MSETIYGLLTTIIINYIDLLMLYLICNKLVEKKTTILYITTCLILPGVILGTLAYYTTGYIFRIIAIVVMLSIIKIISSSRVYDIPILFAITYLCVLFVQVPFLTIINRLPLNNNYSLLLAYAFSFLVIMFIYLKVPLHKILYKVDKQIILKLFIFISIGIFLLIFGYFNFEYENISGYLVYLSIFVALNLAGLFETLKCIFFYTNEVPMKLHDIKNILIGIDIAVHSTSNVTIIKDEIEKSLAILDINSNQENIHVGKYTENINLFITQKNMKNLEIISDINYIEPNAKVPFSIIIYMLGVLLDNAIESGTNKPIYISISVIKEGILISVENEYKKKGEDDFKNMFEEGRSTKSRTGRGYGLPNLIKVVKKHKGKVRIRYEYNKEQRCDYLTIIISISN